MINKLVEFMKKAGATQLDILQKNKLNIRYKDEHSSSIVTKADITVSTMFKKFVAKEFSNLDYFILDEESHGQTGSDIWHKISSAEYVFILDPLDGTLHYSQNIPMFGISVGVFRKGKPYAGILYMPALQELIYRDENKKVYWLTKAFTRDEQIKKISKSTKTTSRLIVDLQHHFSLDKNKNNKDYLFVDYLCSVFSYTLLATGRIRSGMFKDWLWDAAGAWTIFSALGIKIYDFSGNKYLDRLDAKDFTSDLKFKNAHIIGKQEEIEYLQNVIKKDLRL